MSGKPTWYVFGSSVQGATHQRADIPNQDAIDWVAHYGRAPHQVTLAVADGHGSAHYFRSATGARLAVQTAKLLLDDLGHNQQLDYDPSAIKGVIDQQFAHLLTRQWNARVDAHLAAAPFTETELQSVDQAFRNRLAGNPRLPYGSTLVATLVTQTFILYVQVGDGDILTVDETGAVTRPPFQVDKRLFGNVTTSLCLPEAWRYVRTYLQPLAERPPAMILLATDGYANSFVTDDGLLAAAQDIFDITEPQGMDGLCLLRKLLPRWLNQTSQQGSGDDITVGVIYRDTP